MEEKDTASRIKRGLVAAGLALSTVSWLGVSAMPASAVETCSYASGEVEFLPNGEDDDVTMEVRQSDAGKLFIGDVQCTNNFTQTNAITSIQIGAGGDPVEEDLDLDFAFLGDQDVEISVYGDFYSTDSDVLDIYVGDDDPQGPSDWYVGGNIENVTVEYNSLSLDIFNDGDSWYEMYFSGSGDQDTMVFAWDGWVGNWFEISGDEYYADYDGDDTIDASDLNVEDYGTDENCYLGIYGDGGDDNIIGTPEDDCIYGEDGWDTVEDGAGDDYVEANWYVAGSKAQGKDDYYEEDDGEETMVFDYSARTRAVYLINNAEYVSGEVGENDYLDDADSYVYDQWLLAGSGDDTVVADGDAYEYLQGGAGTNRIDCFYESAAATYEFSPNAVTVDLSTGTATGWGTDRLVGCDDAFGSPQDDTITGNEKQNGLFGEGFVGGGNGNDTINGGGEEDYLVGFGGDDTVNGDAGNDFVNGDIGSDHLNGGTGNDCMGACEADEDGNDFFDGGEGNDDMYGGTGEDRVYLSKGTDYFDGDAGRNIVDASKLESKVRIDLQFGEAAWDGWFTELDNTVDAVGSSFDDRIVSWPFGTGDEYIGSKLSGGAGNDDIIGLNGPDQLRGGAGNDVIRAGAGSDNLRGGAGDDELWGGAGVDVGKGAAGNDVCKSIERAFSCSATGAAKVSLNNRI